MSETSPTVTDEQIQALAASAKPYSLVQLRWGLSGTRRARTRLSWSINDAWCHCGQQA
jgi:hypothetical protein